MGQQDDRGKKQEEAPRARRRFSAEFKRDAVDLVLTSGRPVAQAAKELGLYDSTLGNWVLSRPRHKTH